MEIINKVMTHIGWCTIVVFGWFLVLCLWQIIKELAEKLYWKAKVKTLHYKLYVHKVSMLVIPIDYHKFMISFKCEGYEDWIFYANAKSWKEIGAMASKRWGDYLAGREKTIPKTVKSWEYYGEGGLESYERPVDSDCDRPATDGGE